MRWGCWGGCWEDPPGAERQSFLRMALISGMLTCFHQPVLLTCTHRPGMLTCLPRVQDVVHEDLTVRENLVYSARLRLSAGKPVREQLALVEDCIDLLQVGGWVEGRAKAVHPTQRGMCVSVCQHRLGAWLRDRRRRGPQPAHSLAPLPPPAAAPRAAPGGGHGGEARHQARPLWPWSAAPLQSHGCCCCC